MCIRDRYTLNHSEKEGTFSGYNERGQKDESVNWQRLHTLDAITISDQTGHSESETYRFNYTKDTYNKNQTYQENLTLKGNLPTLDATSGTLKDEKFVDLNNDSYQDYVVGLLKESTTTDTWTTEVYLADSQYNYTKNDSYTVAHTYNKGDISEFNNSFIDIDGDDLSDLLISRIYNNDTDGSYLLYKNTGTGFTSQTDYQIPVLSLIHISEPTRPY